MVKRLFGETEDAQFRYLKPRILALGVALVAAVIGALLDLAGLEAAGIFYLLGEAIFVIDLLIFGWAIMKGLFGITSLGILFSNNVVLGVVLFVMYVLVGYLGGLVVAVIGLCRFLVLLKHKKK